MLIAYKVKSVPGTYFLYMHWWFLKNFLSLLLSEANAKFLRASLKILSDLNPFSSVADPDPNPPDPNPPDPHVFRPPGSGSTSQRYGSGS